MRLRLCAALAGIGFALLAVGEPPDPPPDARGVDRPAEFDPPELILDGPGHDGRLFPHYADFDGDGTIDQLVGVGDRLLVYRNQGTDGRPDYARPVWFDEIEPSARIPGG